ncbi:nitrite reductase small subunit NirD [Acidocella aminolytica]|uniref:Nitrite reductase small subunit n=1 Tax=Acidocella aminolytica 101 = DSM 11237 TaxID=1120923 RepID=A0A0D6PFF3_9PROT|nr:nitrite reductase small subunit NirD [Acidocella aminolytica]GAN80086.1 nitrite reductase small subunit [Acidocella aminolytica 101 = DSM 11237]GBQ43574.1 nitrite reductase small subunit [Acidocella aminolytica 101 = DSM 11237]SHE67994.1 assimilatory nitrite reductase (NAD(P)H) small subunit [Acidocella aminolytica 101 = DSM 11237]
MNMISPIFTDVGALADIPRLGARCVKTAMGDIAIFRTADDRVFALRDQCPHKHGPLSQGIVHGTSVTCPLHAWVISLETGEVEGPDDGCTKRFSVKLENGRVLLAVAP